MTNEELRELCEKANLRHANTKYFHTATFEDLDLFHAAREAVPRLLDDLAAYKAVIEEVREWRENHYWESDYEDGPDGFDKLDAILEKARGE